MDDLSPIPEEADIPETPTPRRGLRLRWQYFALAAGLVLIVGAIIYGMLNGPTSVVTRLNSSYSNTQVYTEAVVGQPQWVDPLLATSQADRDLTSLIFSGLTRVDDYGQPAPDLAQSWEVSSDGLTYTFHLRKGVTWQDGQPFSAQDVAFTASLLRDPDFSGPADLGSFWQTVETYADDPLTVRFVLTQPLSAFPEYASIGILPLHILGGIPAKQLPTDPFNLAPIGTGRLRWQSIQKDLSGTTVKLKPFAGFYDSSHAVQLNEVDFRFYSDPNRAFNSLGSSAQGTGAMAYGGLTEAQLDPAFSDPRLQIYTARLPSYAAIIFNEGAPARLPFFQDRSVRAGLARAIDRQSLIDQFLPRSAALTNSTMLPGSWAYNPAITPQPFDIASAGQTLDQAGWALQNGVRAKDGKPITFNLLVSDGSVEQQVGQAVTQAWKGLGINVTMQALPADQLLKRLAAPPAGDQGRNFDAALVEFTQGRLADPDPYPFWHESQIATGQNLSGLSDRDISEALEQAREDSNGVQRTELYRAYQQLFADHSAAILLYNPLYHYAVNCQISGVQLMIFVDPADRFRNMQDWRILPPAQASAACPGS